MPQDLHQEVQCCLGQQSNSCLAALSNARKDEESLDNSFLLLLLCFHIIDKFVVLFSHINSIVIVIINSINSNIIVVVISANSRS